MKAERKVETGQGARSRVLLEIEGLLRGGRREEALAAHDRAIGLQSDSADFIDALAFFARELNRHELSGSLYRRATTLAPEVARYWYNLATSERALGHLAASATACDRALTLEPDMTPAVLLRSEVSRATPIDNRVAELEKRASLLAGRPEAVPLLYALGKELHELGDYDRAFRAFAEGAGIRRRVLHYDVAADEAKLKRIAEVYGAPQSSGRTLSGNRHIFIIGLPRSGTTLTERILSGLPGVISNNETDNFSTALIRAAPKHGGDIFERAAKADDAIVAREYEARAVPQAFTGKIIEKLPFNYLYVGAIRRAFPDAAIVWVARNPLDSCFAMFRTLFASAYPFSYEFSELARYYAAYSRLMQHWLALFPNQIIPVVYEELVARPEMVAPELAARCGLAWADRALDIASNQSASLTASAAQVRAGIYTSSSGLWRSYREHLSPLAAALRSQGVAFDWA